MDILSYIGAALFIAYLIWAIRGLLKAENDPFSIDYDSTDKRCKNGHTLRFIHEKRVKGPPNPELSVDVGQGVIATYYCDVCKQQYTVAKGTLMPGDIGSNDVTDIMSSAFDEDQSK